MGLLESSFPNCLYYNILWRLMVGVGGNYFVVTLLERKTGVKWGICKVGLESGINLGITKNGTE